MEHLDKEGTFKLLEEIDDKVDFNNVKSVLIGIYSILKVFIVIYVNIR